MPALHERYRVFVDDYVMKSIFGLSDSVGMS
jgi:hypothetical protein